MYGSSFDGLLVIPGNVLLRDQNWCVITEFENFSLGLKPLGANANIVNTNKRRDVVAFGMVLYEMASGYQPSDIARVTIPPCALRVQDALHAIFHPKVVARGQTAAASAGGDTGAAIASAVMGLTLAQVVSLDLFANPDGGAVAFDGGLDMQAHKQSGSCFVIGRSSLTSSVRSQGESGQVTEAAEALVDGECRGGRRAW